MLIHNLNPAKRIKKVGQVSVLASKNAANPEKLPDAARLGTTVQPSSKEYQGRENAASPSPVYSVAMARSRAGWGWTVCCGYYDDRIYDSDMTLHSRYFGKHTVVMELLNS